MHATAEKPIISLHDAARLTGLSRDFLRRQIGKGRIKGRFIKPLGRWNIIRESLLFFMHSRGISLQNGSNGRTICIVVVGANLEWTAELSEQLPPGLKAVYAAGLFDCGRTFEREHPSIALIDFRDGRRESIDLGKRLCKAGIDCVAIVNEDEDNRTELYRIGFSKVMMRPVTLEAVREAILGIVS